MNRQRSPSFPAAHPPLKTDATPGAHARLKAEQNMINSYWLLQRVKLLLIELSMPRLANDSDGLGELAALLCTPDAKETDGEIQALIRGGR